MASVEINDAKDIEESSTETEQKNNILLEDKNEEKIGEKRKINNDKKSEPPKKKQKKEKKAKRGWNENEEKLFLEGLELFGRDYSKVSKHIGTRNVASIRSHMQIHLLKLLKNKKKLPKKVLESGNGYTLSGKPLNKYSSTVLKMFKSPKDVPMDMGGVISDEEAANKLKKPKKDKNDNNEKVSTKASTKGTKKKKKKTTSFFDIASDDEFDPESYQKNYNNNNIGRRSRINRKSKNIKKILDHEHDEYQLREDIEIYKPFKEDLSKIRRKEENEYYQPFKIYYCPNALLIGDIHAHLCSQVEIMGFIGGEYNKDKKEVYIKKLYPLKEEEQFEKSVVADAIDQFTVKANIENDGYIYLGWYHSHPCFNNYPSNTDLHQHFVQKRGNDTENPFIGLILSSWNTENSPKCDYRWFNSVREDDGNFSGFEFNVEKKKYLNIDDNNLINQIKNLINRYINIKYDAFRSNLNNIDWKIDNEYNITKLKNKLNKIINNEDIDIDINNNENNENKENINVNCLNNKDKILYSLLLNMDDDNNDEKCSKLINCVINEFNKNKDKWFL